MNWCDCSTIIFFNGEVIALEALLALSYFDWICNVQATEASWEREKLSHL